MGPFKVILEDVCVCGVGGRDLYYRVLRVCVEMDKRGGGVCVCFKEHSYTSRTLERFSRAGPRGRGRE